MPLPLVRYAKSYSAPRGAVAQLRQRGEVRIVVDGQVWHHLKTPLRSSHASPALVELRRGQSYSISYRASSLTR